MGYRGSLNHTIAGTMVLTKGNFQQCQLGKNKVSIKEKFGKHCPRDSPESVTRNPVAALKLMLFVLDTTLSDGVQTQGTVSEVKGRMCDALPSTMPHSFFIQTMAAPQPFLHPHSLLSGFLFN